MPYQNELLIELTFGRTLISCGSYCVVVVRMVEGYMWRDV